jgi:molybdopterin synthase catalytic subunit
MHTLGIVGPGATTLAERLATRLDGRVVTVESFPGAETPLGTQETDAAYGLSADGSWIGAGDHRDLDGLLDDLAPHADYALVAGFPESRLPTVRIADAETTGPVVADVTDATSAPLDDLAALVDDTEPRVTLTSLVDDVKRAPGADQSGAIATFTGRVRAKEDPDDSRTTALEFETYEGVAEERMATISRELEAREGVHAVRMHHRTGRIEDGEDIVFVVVLAGHRGEAFETVSDGIDRLKDEVPIFKREITVDEEFWVHDRE